MKRGSTSALSPGTGASADKCDAQLWNNGGTSLALIEIWAFNNSANAGRAYIKRTTARGTAGSSALMQNTDIGNLFNQPQTAIAPQVYIDLSVFSVEPTIQTMEKLAIFIIPAAVGEGVILTFPEPIIIPSVQGLGIFSLDAAGIDDTAYTFIFEY